MSSKPGPRTPTGYDNYIHGRADYDAPAYPDEPQHAIDARTKAYDALHNLRRGELVPRDAAKAATIDAQAPAMIYYHGGRGYSIDGRPPIVVGKAEHNILAEFMRRPTALTTAELIQCGSANPAVTLRRLKARNKGLFAQAVSLPGGKSGGGYFVRVVPAAPVTGKTC